LCCQGRWTIHSTRTHAMLVDEI